MQQLALAFPVETLYLPQNFIVSETNRAAWEWVHKWPGWPSHCLAVYGPPGSGKTHLAHIWREASGAHFLSYRHLDNFSPLNLPAGPRNFVIEDTGEAGVGEEDFLHFYNYVRESGGSFLLTSTNAPAGYDIKLPDLRSRLCAMPAVALQSPDDTLLSAILRKQLRDRQLSTREEIIQYILPRIERSFSAVRRLVFRLDYESLIQHRPLTIPLVKDVLEESSSEKTAA